jgi:hypothetical protein
MLTVHVLAFLPPFCFAFAGVAGHGQHGPLPWYALVMAYQRKCRNKFLRFLRYKLHVLPKFFGRNFYFKSTTTNPNFISSKQLEPLHKI